VKVILALKSSRMINVFVVSFVFGAIQDYITLNFVKTRVRTDFGKSSTVLELDPFGILKILLCYLITDACTQGFSRQC
jgi:hypothetical protein